MKMTICRNVLFKYRAIQFINTYLIKLRFSHQAGAAYDEPKYPKILDDSLEGRRRHKRQLWYDSIKEMPTVEQKLHEFAEKRSRKFPLYCITSGSCTLTGALFQPYITRTSIINSLPDTVQSTAVDDEFNDMKDILCNVLATNYYNCWGRENKILADHLSEPNSGSSLVHKLLLECYRSCALKSGCFLESTLQLKANVMSFWWFEDYKSNRKLSHERNFCFQYYDHPSCLVRTKKLVEPILPLHDPMCSGEVNNYHYHPKTVGIRCKAYRHITSSPGFWPEDTHEYPLLQVYTSDKVKLQSVLEKHELKEMENGFGVMSSFGWLNAIATYQGFTPFHDLTYPIVGCTILTNGQDWTFFVYQLNTINFHNDTDMKDRKNICWASEKMRLFDTIEDGQVKGINDEVFKTFLKVLKVSPNMNSNIQLKPYLGKDLRTEDEILLMRPALKKMYTNVRPLSEHMLDIPMWQRIYKLHPDAPPSPFVRME